VPFCLVGGTQCCFGRGEILVPAGLEGPPDLAVLLIKHRQASVSTPWAYGRCREMRGDFYLESEAISSSVARPCSVARCGPPCGERDPCRRCATICSPWWRRKRRVWGWG
jgi:4-diphosphocytidyl-2C-methyl-D-erythritol kinase